ncbi:MAG: glycosyltransferase family 2 protein [Pirellulaceae bacterium]
MKESDTGQNTKNVSVIVPLFNEQQSLRELHAELVAVEQDHPYQFEMIFVDDGSTDGSWSEIQKLAAEDSRVFGVRLRRNFGKAAAISAGTVVASHDHVLTIDADLQDDPHEIPRLFAELDKGFDVVSGWKVDRQDPWTRRLASRIFNGMVNTLTKVKLHDHNCGFKLYRREVFDEVDLYGGFHRFVPVLAAARGFKVSETQVHHRKRKYGSSKYGSGRIVKGLLDLMTVCFLTGYSQRPQHLLGTAGIASFLVGMAGLVYMAIYWILRMNFFPDWTPLHQRPVVIYSVAALLLGTQLLTMGFLAELIVARDQKRGRRFAVQETVGSVAGDKSNPEAPANDLPRTSSKPTSQHQ